MEELKEKLLSWPVVIISIIFIWPIGCILLYIKLVNKSGKLKINGILLIITSIFCYFITIIGISITLEDLSNDLGINIFVVMLFLSGAVISTIFGIKSLKQYRSYKRYVEEIGARQQMSIDELAQKTGSSIETTIKNVSGAIKYKMIDAYINNDNVVIINGLLQDEFDSIDIEEPEVITIQCKNCGATNKYITGNENRCEFCNTILVR